ncbi:MAG: pseudouridine synthase [Planctomycetota bacterium]
MIEVLQHDEHYWAVDKPPGILVHRTPMSGDRTALHQLLTEQLGERLFGVHRLDRAASGVLLFARSSEGARALHDAVRAASTVKEYLVCVRDHAPPEFVIDRPLKGRSGEPQPARTECTRLATVDRHSLLRVRTRTGRRHQIRRHLEREAHHVLGDTSHGKGRINAYLREHYGLPRMFLHAWRLAFFDPWTGCRIELRAPLAEDLRAFLLRLPGADRDLVASL